tara:strand:- start:181 stop:1032 length:852 start_codon:yes stop_codon:yes gene_type:complete
VRKILVTGSNGQLGLHFKNIPNSSLFSMIYTHHSPFSGFINMDISNEEQVRSVLQKFNPDIIINTAAITDVDLCQKNKLLARRVNVDGLKNLIKHSKLKAKIIQISSDYIFDGFSGFYSENSTPNPLSYYGKTKLEAENILISSNKNFIIIRVSTLFSNISINFYNWVLSNLSKNNHIKVAKDQISNPCYALNLINFIYDLILLDFNGKINFGSKNSISKLNFANDIADENNLDKHLIEEVKIKDMNFEADRPLNSSFDLSLCSDLNINLFNIKDTLKYMANI